MHFIGKGDTDTYLYLDALAPSVRSFPLNAFVYAGIAIDFVYCGKQDHCPQGFTYFV